DAPTHADRACAYFDREQLAHTGSTAMTSTHVETNAERPPETGDLERKLIRGAILLGVLVAVAVGDHLPFAIVAMGYLIAQFAQVIPVPGGVGTIDAGVTGALVLYGAPTTTTTA